MSTKQLADLAGSTVKTVRHYHAVGLLDSPARTSNGYKQYTVTHLVRLLQIKRLTDLGMSLADVLAAGGGDTNLELTIRALDSDIEGRIEHLRVIRSELADILLHDAGADVPAEFTAFAAGLSTSDRALIMVYSRVLSVDELLDVRTILMHRDPLDDVFDALSPDADDATIENLAEVYAPVVWRLLSIYPWMDRASVGRNVGGMTSKGVVGQAIAALYNPAQLSVMQLIHLSIHKSDSHLDST